jgi:Cu+-exporting ATPase
LVDTSIDRKCVKIIHEAALRLPVLQHSLLDAGFNIRLEYSGASKDAMNESHHTAEVLHGKSGAHKQICNLCSEDDMRDEAPDRRQLDVSGPTSAILANDQATAPDRYKLTLAIGGMTCASCSRTITEAVACIPGVHEVSINFIENSGACVLDADKLAQLVRDTIDDCGYNAQIVSVGLESRNVSPPVKTSIRTVALKVDVILSPSVYFFDSTCLSI